MDMEFMGHRFQRAYPVADMQHQAAHPDPYGQAHFPQHHAHHPYPFMNHHLAALYQHQHRAAMMGQGMMHGSKQTEPKPRLAKDEVELLEQEFSKNPKPNSSTKRELAEQMGVELPRINNWFQNRRAKEKQMRKTAEFEAQQARQRDSSEPKSGNEQEQGAAGEFYPLSNHHQPLGLSTAPFGESDSGNDEDDEAEAEAKVESDAQQAASHEDQGSAASEPVSVQQTTESPTNSESDGFVHVDYDGFELAAPVPVVHNSFQGPQNHGNFQPNPYGLTLGESQMAQTLAGQDFDGLLQNSAAVHMFPERNYFAVPSIPQFPSQMINDGLVLNNGNETTMHEEPAARPETLSPLSMTSSPPAGVDMRFKSPPPPADIAGRRNMRRPAPLGISSLRGNPLIPGPKTGIDAPRRTETASPMRRISSASGTGRIQKPFANSGGPRSPFFMDRNKEALFQSLQAQSPETTEMNTQSLRENTVASASDDDQGYAFGSMNTVGGYQVFKAESTIKTPPDTPGLAGSFPDQFFTNSAEQLWGYIPHDEPLPTPSLCSHQGSELEFSMAPQMPGYIASQPATPSFPPSIGPTYGGFFGGSLANAEYNFPDSYPSESSARSSPGGGPPRSKQFQFAQNVTPQDFHQEK
ncbi:LIM/homeobox protein Lhx3 [Echria macrotheca]|uniref:LIM/homeobox protein Lhx3 n=1 Tax=Echria macrotheca TaxID=438768 RepID=A0AAJ0BFS1_9PEZI|nr:LIM/homeobox protein Lhx3 [Echria macrotheca]